MDYTIKGHGDWFEKCAVNFIQNELPAYELIWSKFIGHDGTGQMAVMMNYYAANEKLRLDFAQYHYTILESLFFMQHIVKDYSEDLKPITSFENYFSTISSIMAFCSFAGKLRDNMLKCFELFVTKDEAKKAIFCLEQIYQERNILLHDRKVPFAIDEFKLFLLPIFNSDSTKQYGYGPNAPWGNMDETKLTYLKDYFDTTLSTLITFSNDLLFNLHDYVKQFIQEKNLILTEPSVLEYPETPISSSQSFSGQMGPQGAITPWAFK